MPLMQLALAVACVSAGRATPHAAALGPRPGAIRPVPGDAFVLLEAARRRSPTVARLLRIVGASDLVLYIEVHPELRGSLGHLTLLNATSGVRRARVAVDARLSTRDQIIVFGHELHHATELAMAADVRDQSAMTAFYQRIGFRSGRRCGLRFDTKEARQASRAIAQEVDTHR